MTEFCVDASIAVKWAVKGEPFRAKARAFLKDAGAKGAKLIAPPFFAGEEVFARLSMKIIALAHANQTCHPNCFILSQRRR